MIKITLDVDGSCVEMEGESLEYTLLQVLSCYVDSEFFPARANGLHGALRDLMNTLSTVVNLGGNQVFAELLAEQITHRPGPDYNVHQSVMVAAVKKAVRVWNQNFYDMLPADKAGLDDGDDLIPQVIRFKDNGESDIVGGVNIATGQPLPWARANGEIGQVPVGSYDIEATDENLNGEADPPAQSGH